MARRKAQKLNYSGTGGSSPPFPGVADVGRVGGPPGQRVAPGHKNANPLERTPKRPAGKHTAGSYGGLAGPVLTNTTGNARAGKQYKVQTGAKYNGATGVFHVYEDGRRIFVKKTKQQLADMTARHYS